MDDEQSLLNETEPQEETAAQAFARLDRRIAMLTRVVENMAAERMSIEVPDYSATLEQMNTRLAALVKGMAVIADKPAMTITPEGLAARMNAAAEQSRASDWATLRETRETHQELARIIHSLVGVLRGADEQRKRLLWAAGGGLAAGCLLCSALPGVIVRALPMSWHVPERVAAHIIGEPTLWDAGARMMGAGDPASWAMIIQAIRARNDNQDAISACEKAAAKGIKSVRCIITIGNPLHHAVGRSGKSSSWKVESDPVGGRDDSKRYESLSAVRQRRAVYTPHILSVSQSRSQHLRTRVFPVTALLSPGDATTHTIAQIV
jgi:hypothetical protein